MPNIKKIKIIPSWVAAFSIYIAAVEMAQTKKAKAEAWESFKAEALRLAAAVDKHQASE